MDISGNSKQEDIQVLMARIKSKIIKDDSNVNHFNYVWGRISEWLDECGYRKDAPNAK
jgi:hypothetical protein